MLVAFQAIADNLVEVLGGNPFAYLSHLSRDFSVFCQITPFFGRVITFVWVSCRVAEPTEILLGRSALEPNLRALANLFDSSYTWTSEALCNDPKQI